MTKECENFKGADLIERNGLRFIAHHLLVNGERHWDRVRHEWLRLVLDKSAPLKEVNCIIKTGGLQHG
ncbi:MAG TPA: hypothetical protein VH593_10350 [Ktedonobacteraceae bacterium]